MKPVSILQKFASKLSLDENPIKKKNVLLIDIELQNYKTIINNTSLEFQEFWIEHEKLLPRAVKTRLKPTEICHEP